VVVRTVSDGLSVFPSHEKSSPFSVAFSLTLVLLMVAFNVPAPFEPKTQSGSTSTVARHAGRPPLVAVSGTVHGGYAWTRLDLSDLALAGNECASHRAAATRHATRLRPISPFMLCSPASIQLMGGRPDTLHDPPGTAS